MKYKEIHIWDFPPTRTFIHLDDKFREKLFLELREKIGVEETISILNQRYADYQKRIYRYNSSHFYEWKKGFKKDRNHVDRINIDIWVLIEISKILSKLQKWCQSYVTCAGMVISVVELTILIIDKPINKILIHLYSNCKTYSAISKLASSRAPSS